MIAPAHGPARRRAGTVVVSLVALLFLACHAAPAEPSDGELSAFVVDEDDDSDIVPPPAEPAALTVITYETTGQAVHPDAFVSRLPWNGRRFWYAATPYPAGNAYFENPSIYAGRNSREWEIPAGAENPVVRPVLNYLSDPDLVYDAGTDKLRLYYRETSDNGDFISLKTSSDGVVWSDPTLVVSGARWNLISPAIVHEPDDSWRMWTVGARVGGCTARASAIELTQRQSVDGISWGAASPMLLAIPGRVPWHLDVQWIEAKHEYWALVAAFPDGKTCAETAVFFARSADGTTWNVSRTPILAPGALEPLRDMVYRSTFHYMPRHDLLIVWFSGARLESGAYHYSLASARYTLADFMRRVERTESTTEAVLRNRIDAPLNAADSSARAEFVRTFP